MPRRNPQTSEEQQQPTSILRRSTRLQQKTLFNSQSPLPENPNFQPNSPFSTPKKKPLIPKPPQPARTKRNAPKKPSIPRSDNENSNAKVGKKSKGMDSTLTELEKRVTRSSIRGKSSDELENPSLISTRRKRYSSVEGNSSEGRHKLGSARDFCREFSSKLQKSKDREEKLELDLKKIGKEEKNDDHVDKKNVGLKRKRNQTGQSKGMVNGWNPKQESALQRAYLATKPTPHFWKKVAKLVPGKSAQECFNKIHSDHSTPPQVQPRTRARTNSSSSLSFSLSPSDLLKSPVLKVNKRKSVISHKNVRQLLQKSYKIDQNYETDLFSALESTSNPPVVVHTPDKKLNSPQSLLKNCQKKEMSRFSKEGLVSPPVLKQVKNRVLHDRYIDRLRTREAKRKSVFLRTAKGSKKEDKIDVVKTAKDALVSEARDAINLFRNVQAEAMNIEFLDEDEENDEDCD